MSDQTLATMKQVPAADLGGPCSPDPELCAMAAIAALRDAAGEGFRLTSLSLELASRAIGEGMVAVAIQTDKRTKAIVFVSVEARIGAAMVFSAQALFSRGAV